MTYEIYKVILIELIYEDVSRLEINGPSCLHMEYINENKLRQKLSLGQVKFLTGGNSPRTERPIRWNSGTDGDPIIAKKPWDYMVSPDGKRWGSFRRNTSKGSS